MCEEINCPGNRFKMNQKWHDWTFDQSSLLLCNNETVKSGLRHRRCILMSHTSHTCFNYSCSCAIVKIPGFYMKLVQLVPVVLNRRSALIFCQSAKQPRFSVKKLKIASVHVEFGKILINDMWLAIE